MKCPEGDVRFVSSLPDALAAAKAEALKRGTDEVFVIGGGEIYQQALPLADQLDLTEVDITLGAQADAHFPAWDDLSFQELECHDYPVSPERPLAFRVRVLARKPA